MPEHIKLEEVFANLEKCCGDVEATQSRNEITRILTSTIETVEYHLRIILADVSNRIRPEV